MMKSGGGLTAAEMVTLEYTVEGDYLDGEAEEVSLSVVDEMGESEYDASDEEQEIEKRSEENEEYEDTCEDEEYST